MKEAIRLAGANGGWLLALGIALVAIVVSTYAYNVVQKAENAAVEPVAKEINAALGLGLITGSCPDGWSHSNITDAHAAGETCFRDPWVVVMYPPPNDKKANYGFNTADPTGVTVPCREIPGWPEGWCVDE